MLRRLILPVLFLLLAGGAVAQYVGYGTDDGYVGYAGYGPPASASNVDTFKLLVQNSATPPVYGTFGVPSNGTGWLYDESWYDTVTEANDGTAIRWGGTDNLSTALPAFRINGARASEGDEDDQVSQPRYKTFIAFNIGEIPSGSKIESAALMLPVMNAEANDLSTGFMAARLDTIVSDYDMLNSVAVTPTNGDANWLETAYSKVDLTNTVNWSPTLTARDDFHDFGPRSEIYAPKTNLSSNTPVKLDVTDALQQAVDNGATGGWAIFMVYMVDSPASVFSWGFSSVSANVPVGSPALSVVSTSRRGPKPWSGIRVPIALTFDDGTPDQVGFYRALTDSGLTFDIATYRTNALLYTWHDSIHELNPENINWIMHSRTHPTLGPLTGNPLDYQLTRDWLNDDVLTTPVDTLALLDYAWTGGSPTPTRDVEAMERMVDFGYRSSRDIGYVWNTADPAMEHSTRMSWDGYFNKYMVHGVAGQFLFEDGGSPVTTAELEERLTDLIDKNYTDYGKSSIIIYAHSFASEKVTEPNLRHFAGFVSDLNSASILPYGEIVRRRLAASTSMTPAQVVTAEAITTDSQQIRTMAAMHDSIYDIGGHDNLLDTWVGPAGWEQEFLVAITARPNYLSADSLKANGGRFDYIVNTTTDPSGFLSGYIRNDLDTATSHNSSVNRFVISNKTSPYSYWSDTIGTVSMVHFPMGGLPFFTGSEVISADYYVVHNAVDVFASTDTMFVVGGNRSDILWHNSGQDNTNRLYMNATGTTAWPTRNGSTDPKSWLGLDAISTADYADHAFKTSFSTSTSTATIFDLSYWVQSVADGGLNGGLWYMGHNSGGAQDVLPIKETSTNTNARPLVIIRYKN